MAGGVTSNHRKFEKKERTKIKIRIKNKVRKNGIEKVRSLLQTLIN